jgi:Zn finger protein HypA/HybF involved in hydrogenase expression
MRNDILERKNEILIWIVENKSKSFICKELKCKPITLENWLNKMNIRYKGNQGSKGGISNNKKNIYFYLKNGTLITSYKLKNKLIKENIKEKKCEKCLRKKWNNEDIPLELHHIDGQKCNNELTNLQILCPNCHAQTKTYRSKNCKK